MMMIKHDVNRKMMASRKIGPLQLFLFELIVVFCSSLLSLSTITNDCSSIALCVTHSIVLFLLTN